MESIGREQQIWSGLLPDIRYPTRSNWEMTPRMRTNLDYEVALAVAAARRKPQTHLDPYN